MNSPMTSYARTDLQADVERLEPWFHNLHLPGGVQTAPGHELGDFPANKWRHIAPSVPENLAGWSVLDVGCNAGFYSFELARRGAHVTAIDVDPHYLKQAEWGMKVLGLEHRIELRQMQLYDLARTDEMFDLVWFMGVFYHLRYPMLGLDILAKHTRRMMVFQTMSAPGKRVVNPPENIGLKERRQMLQPGWPALYFIERRLANDPTNWWAANHACIEALLRSAGFNIVCKPAHEIYVCDVQRTDSLGIGELLDAEYHSATGLNAAAAKPVNGLTPPSRAS